MRAWMSARKCNRRVRESSWTKGMQESASANATPDSVSEEELANFKSAVLAKLAVSVGKDAALATDRDWFVATANAIRDRIIYRWLSAARATSQGSKQVYYLSLEFLIGRLLSDVLCN